MLSLVSVETPGAVLARLAPPCSSSPCPTRLTTSHSSAFHLDASPHNSVRSHLCPPCLCASDKRDPDVSLGLSESVSHLPVSRLPPVVVSIPIFELTWLVQYLVGFGAAC